MATVEQLKECLKQILDNLAAENERNGGGADIGGAGGATNFNPDTDKKTPKKKKKPENKEIERLRKKVTQDKVKLAQLRKELRNKKLSDTLERAEKRFKKEEERIKSLKDKLNVSTGQ